MIKFRYKYYIILFIIFIVISVSLATVINMTANYSREDLENVYYNIIYEEAKKDIIIYADGIYKMIMIENERAGAYDGENTTDIVSDFINGAKDESSYYEIYIQEAVAYDDSSVSVRDIYSSEYEADGEYKKYGENDEAKEKFYPSCEVLSKLKQYEYGAVFDSESFIVNKKNEREERFFYSRYIRDANIVITACFYDRSLRASASAHAQTLETEKEETVSFFLFITIFIIIVLFLTLCYIESLYYKKVENSFLSEKLKIDEKYNDLKKQSQIDALTKCYNRKYLNEKMAFAFKSFASGHLVSSAILFDVDNFKRINDTYGHSAGDEVLKRVSETVRECIRKEDVLARWGGEEFIVFFKFTNVNITLVIAEKIRAAIESMVVEIPEHHIKVTVSLGVSCFKAVDSDLTECIERADDAMYESKRTGKNKVTLYSK